MEDLDAKSSDSKKGTPKGTSEGSPLKSDVDIDFSRAKFQITFFKQFRAVFLKNMSELLHMKKTIAYQAIVTLVLLASVVLIKISNNKKASSAEFSGDRGASNYVNSHGI